MALIYNLELNVPQETIDENGHVNNLEYLRWILDAASLHADTDGVSAATRAAGATWIVRSHRIEYLRPAFAGEHVCIWTWVSSIRRVQSLRKYKIIRQEDSSILTEGETDWVFIDARSGRLRSITKDIKARFEILPENMEASVLKTFGLQLNITF